MGMALAFVMPSAGYVQCQAVNYGVPLVQAGMWSEVVICWCALE